jgi:hypothetical protein
MLFVRRQVAKGLRRVWWVERMYVLLLINGAHDVWHVILKHTVSVQF